MERKGGKMMERKIWGLARRKKMGNKKSRGNVVGRRREREEKKTKTKNGENK